jgi:hypothetical protein
MEEFGEGTIAGQGPTAPQWKGASSIGMVHRFNARCIELISVVAADEPGRFIPAISNNRSLWLGLPVEACRRVAGVPFVLVDVHFADAAWWHRTIQALSEMRVVGPGVRDFSLDASTNLTHETIMFAWQLVGSNRMAAMLAFGMIPPVAEMLATLTPRDLPEIAARHPSAACLRWVDDASLWSGILQAATSADEKRLARLRLHTKLLLCGDLVQMEEE